MVSPIDGDARSLPPESKIDTVIPFLTKVDQMNKAASAIVTQAHFDTNTHIADLDQRLSLLADEFTGILDLYYEPEMSAQLDKTDAKLRLNVAAALLNSYFALVIYNRAPELTFPSQNLDMGSKAGNLDTDLKKLGALSRESRDLREKGTPYTSQQLKALSQAFADAQVRMMALRTMDATTTDPALRRSVSEAGKTLFNALIELMNRGVKVEEKAVIPPESVVSQE